MSDVQSGESHCKYYQIRKSDLPLSCPMPNQSAWDAHPRIFLDIEQKKDIQCPYCGARYVLIDD